MTISSCTDNGNEGIFEQIVNSSSSSTYRIKQYLGSTTSGTFFFVEENGLYKNGRNVYPGNFSSGYMTGTNLYLYNGRDAGIYFCEDVTADTIQLTPFLSDTSKTFNKLTQDGFAVETTRTSTGRTRVVDIWDLDNKTVISPLTNLFEITSNTSSHYASILSSEGALLIEFNNEDGDIEDNYHFLYDSETGNFSFVSNLEGKLIGAFQKVNKDLFFAVYSRSDSKDIHQLYKIVTSGSDYKADYTGKTTNSLPKYGFQAPSVYNKDFKDGSIVIRSVSRYEVFNTESYSYSEADTGFAEGICAGDMELMNILPYKPAEDLNRYIFAFYKYGLFEVDISADKMIRQIKF